MTPPLKAGRALAGPHTDPMEPPAEAGRRLLDETDGNAAGRGSERSSGFGSRFMSWRPSPHARGFARRRLGRRLTQLYAGLVLFGVSMALLVEAHLGVMPWDVLHQGLSRRTGASLGTMTIIVGVVVLLLWIPLRERPGLGTVSNVLVIGVAVDAAVALLPTPSAPALRVGFVVAGIVLNAVATAAYIGARFGPGPRDGLMTGLVRRTGGSVGRIKTAIEVGVVGIGWLLGGTVGLATLAFAVGVGPLVHLFMPRLAVPPAAAPLPSS